MMADGVTPAPSWITVVTNADGSFSVQVDKDANEDQAPAVLDLKLVATVVGKTTAQKSVDWKLTMYTYVPSTLADKVYVINTAGITYSFPPFSVLPVGTGTPDYASTYKMVL